MHVPCAGEGIFFHAKGSWPAKNPGNLCLLGMTWAVFQVLCRVWEKGIGVDTV